MLVAIDASPQAQGLLDWTLDRIFRLESDRLHIVTVAEPPLPPVMVQPEVESHRKHGLRELQRVISSEAVAQFVLA